MQEAAGGGIGPARGSHWPPSRKREEASALRNLKRALANRVLRTGDDEDDDEHEHDDERPDRDADAELAEQVANLALDNRKQLLERVSEPALVALVALLPSVRKQLYQSPFVLNMKQ